jgi:hypothetical protein
LKEKEPVVVGLCVSSRAFVGWPNENPVDIEGTVLVFPNVPNALGSSALSLGAKRFDGDEPPKENGEVVLCDPPPNDVPVEEVLNENPLPEVTAGLLTPLDCWISLVGLSSILYSLSGFLGGVTGLSVGATTLCWPNGNDCPVETSVDVLPPPPKLNISGGGATVVAVVPDG